MIAIAEQTCQPTHVEHDEQFLQMVPAIKRYARIAFCDLLADEREEAIAEVLCAAFSMFRRLAEQGKQHLGIRDTTGALCRGAFLGGTSRGRQAELR